MMKSPKNRWLPWLSAATLLAALAITAPPVHANSAGGTRNVVSPHVVTQTAQLCLRPSPLTAYGFGAATNWECAGGYAKVTVWRLAPRYGRTVLIAISGTQLSGGSIMMFPAAIPAAHGATGVRAVALTISGGTLEAAPGAVGADYTSAAEQQLAATTATAGVTIGRAQALIPVPAGAGVQRVWRVLAWQVPAAGGTLNWYFDSAAGTPIHVGAVAPLPAGWKVTTTAGMTANPTIGASYMYSGRTAAQAAAALQAAIASGTTGWTTFAASGGAHINLRGTYPLTLAGVIATWTDPRPGQSVTVRTVVHVPPATAGPNSPGNEQLGTLTPIAGLKAILQQTQTPQQHGNRVETRRVTVTPTGTQIQITALTLRASSTARPVGQWVPVTVLLTRDGHPLTGTVTLTARGLAGARLRSATVRVGKSGIATDAVTATAAGRVALGAAYAGMRARTSARILPLFPWWILLLLIAALALAAGYWRLRVRRRQTGAPPTDDAPVTTESPPDPEPPAEGTGDA